MKRSSSRPEQRAVLALLDDHRARALLEQPLGGAHQLRLARERAAPPPRSAARCRPRAARRARGRACARSSSSSCPTTVSCGASHLAQHLELEVGIDVREEHGRAPRGARSSSRGWNVENTLSWVSSVCACPSSALYSPRQRKVVPRRGLEPAQVDAAASNSARCSAGKSSPTTATIRDGREVARRRARSRTPSRRARSTAAPYGVRDRVERDRAHDEDLGRRSRGRLRARSIRSGAADAHAARGRSAPRSAPPRRARAGARERVDVVRDHAAGVVEAVELGRGLHAGRPGRRCGSRANAAPRTTSGNVRERARPAPPPRAPEATTAAARARRRARAPPRSAGSRLIRACAYCT